MKQRYRYAWKNNEKRKQLYNRECYIQKRLGMNSALIVMCDTGVQEVVSRNALRRVRG